MNGVRTVAAMVVTAALVVASALGCTSPDSSQEAFCEQLPRVPPLETVLAGFDDIDPDQLDRRLQDASEAYGELRRSAPDDIDGPVDTVVDLVDVVIETVTEQAADPERVADELREVTARHPGVDAASQEVVAYAAAHCDVDLDPPVAPDRTDGEGGS